MIARRIKELQKRHGGLRAASRALKIDVAYLKRLRDGEKTNPSQKILKRLGLKLVVTFEDV